MVFSTVTFLFFFLPAFLLCYALLPFRNATLLLFSAIFYIWGEGVFFLVLVLSVVINYIAGAWIGTRDHPGRKKALAAGIAANLFLLVYFKYSGFLLFQIFNQKSFDPSLVPHLLLGISFFTFQSLTYLVDIYRRDAKPANSVWDLALYIMMFPQLIAGPIVRYSMIARQINQRTIHFNYAMHGLQFFAVGLAQKVLIANNVAGVADAIFALPDASLSGPIAWTGAVTYTLQIYFDFAGYSNMAIGLGLFMGFKFPQNFNYPYISQSITEFWRRWHISLATWFRDYLYIPLGGNRRGALITYRNLLVVFLLCGLWHGASWTFIAWGMYHGVLLIMERAGLSRLLDAVPRGLRHLYAMLAVLFGWVLFRAESFDQATAFIRNMLLFPVGSPATPGIREYLTHQQVFFTFVGVIAATPLARYLLTRVITDRDKDVKRRPAGNGPLRNVTDITFAFVLVLICAIYSASGTYNPFIYFRF